ncbi:MAG: PHP domain-containing protein [Chloroflexota bacterium]|nr:PHP domain-containing protein [Chloroflexota bacterium]
MYKKLDLHIHTPHSLCYVDHMMPEARRHTPLEDIIDAALACGLDAIAITDHNTVAAIEELRTIGTRDGLCILPGCEVSARGGHVLGIFDPDTPLEVLHHLLGLLGLTEEHQGQGFHETSLWLDEVSRHIEGHGGLAIAAHIDRRPKGFIASELPMKDKRRIYTCGHISALEITLPTDRERWQQGLVPHFPEGYACCQGSDAHEPREVGRRPIYCDIPTIDVAGLRLAFGECTERVRFPEDLAAET